MSDTKLTFGDSGTPDYDGAEFKNAGPGEIVFVDDARKIPNPEPSIPELLGMILRELINQGEFARKIRRP